MTAAEIMQRLGKHSLSVVGEIHVGICVAANRRNERNLPLVFIGTDMNHPPKGTTSAMRIDYHASFSPQPALAVRYHMICGVHALYDFAF